MFNAFKRLIGDLPQREYSLALFPFASIFKIENKKLRVYNNELSKTNIIYKQFNRWDEIEIKCYKTDTSLDFGLTTDPQTDFYGDTVYQCIDKRFRVPYKLIMASDKHSLQMYALEKPDEGYFFSDFDMAFNQQYETQVKEIAMKQIQLAYINRDGFEKLLDTGSFMITAYFTALTHIEKLDISKMFTENQLKKIVNEAAHQFMYGEK